MRLKYRSTSMAPVLSAKKPLEEVWATVFLASSDYITPASFNSPVCCGGHIIAYANCFSFYLRNNGSRSSLSALGIEPGLTAHMSEHAS